MSPRLARVLLVSAFFALYRALVCFTSGFFHHTKKAHSICVRVGCKD
jgi:hypothetical protein